MSSDGKLSNTARQITDEFIRSFERRARFLRATAALILLFAFGLLGLGAFLFLKAPEFASQDITAGGTIQETLEEALSERDLARRQFEVGMRSPLELMSKEKRLSDLQIMSEIAIRRREQHSVPVRSLPLDQFANLEEVRIALRIKDRLVKTLLMFKDIQEEMLEGGIGSSSDLMIADLELVRAKRGIEDLKLRHDRFATQMTGKDIVPLIGFSLGDQGREPASTTHLAQTNIFRFGALLVIFFFISILQPIFRYNTQLGAYYDARADSLILFRASNGQDLETLTKIFTPSLRFEKTPSGSGQQSSEIVKELISAAARQDRR